MNKIVKELLKAFGIGAIIFIVLFVISKAQGNTWENDTLVFYGFLFTMLYSIVLYFVNSVLFIYLNKKFDKSNMPLKRAVVGFGLSFMVTLFCVFLLRILEDVIIEGETFRQFLAEETLSNYYFAMGITIIILLLIHSFHFYKAYQENRVKREKIIAGTASAQFETLKNQIDPHFLFNSLNVLSSLIEENPDNAQRFTTSLSKIYRYVLEQKDKELVSIQEELSFAKTYMNLLKMRFENSVFYEVQEIANPDAKVVPLSLQLLLENTVKHNVVSPQRPLYIRIFEKDGYLVVQNDLQKKEVLRDRKGVGLQNIVNRYAILTERNVLVHETDKHFTVKLPILTKQLSIMEPSVYNREEGNYLKAQKKIEEIKGFYSNLSAYVVVIIGLAVLNLVTYPYHLWFLYPAIGWGIGVVIHGVNVFNYMPFLSRDWEERKINELMEKDKSKKWR